MIENLSNYFSDVPPAKPLQLDTAINLSLSSPCASNSEHNNADHIPNISHRDFLVVQLMSHLQLVSQEDLFHLLLMQTNMFQYPSGPYCYGIPQLLTIVTLL